jgi:hypothetical protein
MIRRRGAIARLVARRLTVRLVGVNARPNFLARAASRIRCEAARSKIFGSQKTSQYSARFAGYDRQHFVNERLHIFVGLAAKFVRNLMRSEECRHAASDLPRS